MVTLFDQQKVMEIHDYNVRQESRKEGLNEGIEKGISSLVTSLKLFNIDKHLITQEIARQYHLLPQEAEEKVEKYWNQQ